LYHTEKKILISIQPHQRVILTRNRKHLLGLNHQHPRLAHLTHLGKVIAKQILCNGGSLFNKADLRLAC